MWTEFNVIPQIKIAQTYNMVLFYLQKIPLIGKHIPNRFFHAETFKHLILILGSLFYIIGKFFTKVLYFSIVFLASSIIHSSSLFQGTQLSQVLLVVLFFLSVINGSFISIQNISPDDTFDILCLKQLDMNPKRFYLSQSFLNFTQFLISYTIVLAFIFSSIGIDFYRAIFLTVLLIGIRILVQLINIHMHQLESDKPSRNYMILATGMNLVGFAGLLAYAFNLFSFKPNFMISLPAFLVGLLLILVCLPILLRTNRYKEITRSVLSTENIQNKQLVAEEVRAAEVKLDDEDIVVNQNIPLANETTGISYINALFFGRLGHQLKRRVRCAAIIMSAVFLIALVVLVAARYLYLFDLPLDQIESFFAGPWHIIIIYISVLVYTGEYFSKFCFFNMDRMLMENNFYRQPKYLFEAIWIRFKVSVQYNFPLLLLLLLGTGLIYFVADGRSIQILLLAFLSSTIMMLFFSLHYLILYYLLQPYTVSMESKNPLYNVITFLTYYLPYMLLDFSATASQSSVLIIYSFIIVYLIVSLVAVRLFAPKRFKLR